MIAAIETDFPQTTYYSTADLHSPLQKNPDSGLEKYKLFGLP